MIDLTSINDFFSNKIARLVAAITILLIGVLFARFLSKLTQKILNEIKLNDILKNEMGIKIRLEEFFSRLIEYIIYFLAIIIALNQLGLTTTMLYVILVAILVIIILLLVFAFKDFVPNITAGLYISKKGILKKGDIVEVKSVKGEIIDINLIETKIKTKEGDEVLVPNSVLFKSEVRKLKK